MFAHTVWLTRLAAAFAVATTIYLLAVTSASASASWLIEGSELAGTAALATKETVTEAFKLEAAGVTVECTANSVNATGSEIQAPNLILASSLSFNECAASGGGCSLATKTIATLPLLAEVIQSAIPEDIAMLRPKTSKTLAVIHLEGASCALSGVQPVTGTKLPFLANLPKGQEEKALQPLKAEVLTGQIQLGSSAARLRGALLLGLATGKAYSYTTLNKPKINTMRVAGGVRNLPGGCAFEIEKETCEVEIQVVDTGKAAELEFDSEIFDNFKEAGFKRVEGAKKPECEEGKAIGAVNAKCYIKIQYTGISMPGIAEYATLYILQAGEKGGTERDASAMILIAEG